MHYEVRDRIAHVTIANGKANALSPDVIAGLDAALDAGRGRGRERGRRAADHRRAGHALGRLRPQGHAQSSPAAAGKLVTDGGELFTRMFGSQMPVVVACTGHAVAAGALLLLGADDRIGARGEFRIGLIETQIGMVLPRWAVELAQERLSPPPPPGRDGRRPDLRPRRRASTPGSSTRSSTPDALDASRARRGRSAGRRSRAARTGARCG